MFEKAFENDWQTLKNIAPYILISIIIISLAVFAMKFLDFLTKKRNRTKNNDEKKNIK